MPNNYGSFGTKHKWFNIGQFYARMFKTKNTTSEFITEYGEWYIFAVPNGNKRFLKTEKIENINCNDSGDNYQLLTALIESLKLWIDKTEKKIIIEKI
jgi:hypothetical protein